MSMEQKISEQQNERLHVHQKYPHIPRNVNVLHQEERTGINDRIAVFLTHTVGSMPTAYLFVILAFIGLLGILGIFSPLVALLIAWLSQTLIQLVLLPVIMVGSNVIGRHAEIQADEQFQTTQKSYHDLEQIMLHLEAQDRELLKQTTLLTTLLSQGNTKAVD